MPSDRPPSSSWVTAFLSTTTKGISAAAVASLQRPLAKVDQIHKQGGRLILSLPLIGIGPDRQSSGTCRTFDASAAAASGANHGSRCPTRSERRTGCGCGDDAKARPRSELEEVTVPRRRPARGVFLATLAGLDGGAELRELGPQTYSHRSHSQLPGGSGGGPFGPKSASSTRTRSRTGIISSSGSTPPSAQSPHLAIASSPGFRPHEKVGPLRPNADVQSIDYALRRRNAINSRTKAITTITNAAIDFSTVIGTPGTPRTAAVQDIQATTNIAPP
ncbi:hypothetical protein MKZ38_002917 [Zalerion maritima]|uniref:Uncharacterized protein n=1 Tax=Zalerion maritima TaxID=339359 RepID=A0AAD5WQI3_9PEZI|nr:hypothetical protein MKZ38_002917 [Zalerion maritima]